MTWDDLVAGELNTKPLLLVDEFGDTSQNLEDLGKDELEDDGEMLI